MKTIHFHTKRGCLSYLTYDENSKEALIIDPSEECDINDYLKALTLNDLKLKYIIETHTHADHISSAKEIKSKTEAKIVRSKFAPSKTADVYVDDNDIVMLGEEKIKILYTPGHTNESISIYNGKEIFTGDTLFIGGTGRTDFQIGDSDDLYDSIHEKIMFLPLNTLVRPGHNYQGKNVATLNDEINKNERIALCRESFVQTLDAHHPPKPDLFEEAIKKNSE